MPTPKPYVDPVLRDRLRGWLSFKRKQLRLTKTALAEMLGFTTAQVSRVLSGRRAVGLDLFVAMRNKLHLPVDAMLDRDPPALTLDGTELGLAARPKN